MIGGEGAGVRETSQAAVCGTASRHTMTRPLPASPGASGTYSSRAEATWGKGLLRKVPKGNLSIATQAVETLAASPLWTPAPQTLGAHNLSVTSDSEPVVTHIDVRKPVVTRLRSCVTLTVNTNHMHQAP